MDLRASDPRDLYVHNQDKSQALGERDEEDEWKSGPYSTGSKMYIHRILGRTRRCHSSLSSHKMCCLWGAGLKGKYGAHRPIPKTGTKRASFCASLLSGRCPRGRRTGLFLYARSQSSFFLLTYSVRLYIFAQSRFSLKHVFQK